MGAEDKVKGTASELARGVKEATADVAAKARDVVGGLLPGERGERAPDPETGATEPAAPSAAVAPTDPGTPVPPPDSGADTSEDLREISPEPGNRAGVHDTAGDRADHG